jgi:hypothetical protein
LPKAASCSRLTKLSKKSQTDAVNAIPRNRCHGAERILTRTFGF